MSGQSTAMTRVGQSGAVAVRPAYTDEQIQIIKNTIARGTSDNELALFIATATRLKLDPFAKQIYAVMRRSKLSDGTWTNVMTIMVGIDGLRLIAERTGEYLPAEELPTFTYDANGELYSCETYVQKWDQRTQTWRRIPEIAFYSEYVEGFWESGKFKPNANWDRKRHMMLAKCCEARGIRKAHPHETGDVSLPEEFGETSDGEQSVVEIVAEKPRMSAPPPPRQIEAPARGERPAQAALERGQAVAVANEKAAVVEDAAQARKRTRTGAPRESITVTPALGGGGYVGTVGPKSGEIDKAAAGDFLAEPVPANAAPMVTSGAAPVAAGVIASAEAAVSDWTQPPAVTAVLDGIRSAPTVAGLYVFFARAMQIDEAWLPFTLAEYCGRLLHLTRNAQTDTDLVDTAAEWKRLSVGKLATPEELAVARKAHTQRVGELAIK